MNNIFPLIFQDPNRKKKGGAEAPGPSLGDKVKKVNERKPKEPKPKQEKIVKVERILDSSIGK